MRRIKLAPKRWAKGRASYIAGLSAERLNDLHIEIDEWLWVTRVKNNPEAPHNVGGFSIRSVQNG